MEPHARFPRHLCRGLDWPDGTVPGSTQRGDVPLVPAAGREAAGERRPLRGRLSAHLPGLRRAAGGQVPAARRTPTPRPSPTSCSRRPAPGSRRSTSARSTGATRSPGVSRFRATIFKQRGSWGAVMRTIPFAIPDFEPLNLPPVVRHHRRGAPRADRGDRRHRQRQVHHHRRHHQPHHPAGAAPRGDGGGPHRVHLPAAARGWSSSARSARTPPATPTRCAPRSARTRTSSWWASCATGSRPTSASRRPRPATWSSPRCTPPTCRGPSAGWSGSSPPTSRRRCGPGWPTTSRRCVALRLLMRADAAGLIPAVEALLATSTVRELIRDGSKVDELRTYMETAGADLGMHCFDQYLYKLHEAEAHLPRHRARQRHQPRRPGAPHHDRDRGPHRVTLAGAAGGVARPGGGLGRRRRDRAPPAPRACGLRALLPARARRPGAAACGRWRRTPSCCVLPASPDATWGSALTAAARRRPGRRPGGHGGPVARGGGAAGRGGRAPSGPCRAPRCWPGPLLVVERPRRARPRPAGRPRRRRAARRRRAPPPLPAGAARRSPAPLPGPTSRRPARRAGPAVDLMALIDEELVDEPQRPPPADAASR